ncbi:MAG: DUF3025 domain-containing protein [Polyangiaceae bacterium]
MTGAARFDARFLERPAFSVFEPIVCKRLAALAHFPEPGQLRALSHGIPSAIEPWFDFAPQNDAEVDRAGGFDALIAETSRIPTRAGSFHDFLGALVWLHFPALKTAIHRVQLAAAKQARGPRENAATHLDESGALVISTDVRVFEAIADLQWPALFWKQRLELAGSTRCLAFGHGLLDAFREPHPRLMGKALCVRVSSAQLALSAPALRVLLDAELARRLPEFLLAPGRLLPLPVLGVPGWTERQTPEFYSDQRYFRTVRTRQCAPVACTWLDLTSSR